MIMAAPPRPTQQYRLASILPGNPPQAFPTLISSLIPLICLSTVNSSPSPGIVPPSPNTSSKLLCLLGDLCPCVCGVFGCGEDCLILIQFKLPQISWFTLSLKCFSSDPDSCSHVTIGHLLQFSHPPRAGPVLLTLLFFPLVPSSYWDLWFDIFFSTDQVLLSTLNWCSANTSVSEGVFLMYVEQDVFHIHLPLCHLVHLDFLTIRNKIAMNIHVQVLFFSFLLV